MRRISLTAKNSKILHKQRSSMIFTAIKEEEYEEEGIEK